MSRNEADVRAPGSAVLPEPQQEGGEQLSLFSPQAMKTVEANEARWRRESLDPILAKKPFWKKDFTTVSNMEVNPYATPLNIADQDFREIANPGEFPYTRGIHPTGYRGRLWTMRQFAGFGSAKQTNE